MFSPYYARARRRGRAEPENHVAINVALYGAGGHRWAMTERGRRSLDPSRERLVVGPSRASWHSDDLVIEIDEIGAPLPQRIRGRIVVTPRVWNGEAFSLDEGGGHIWQPIAPLARVAVELDKPRQSWSGAAYVDHNRGAEPLEARFARWSWSRTIEVDRTRVFYDVTRLDGTTRGLHLEFARDGDLRPVSAPPMQSLSRSLWGLPLAARSETAGTGDVLARWEDGPFYARSLIEQTLAGASIKAVHELVSLERFSRRWVQFLLPFRMPRRSWNP